MKNTWKKSDLIDGAIFRKVDEFVEVYMARPYSTVYMGYPVFHGLISFDEVELARTMRRISSARKRPAITPSQSG